MNMKKFLIAATLAFGMATSMQAANATTTDELLQYCKGDGSTNVTCQIYGQAVYDTYLATRNPKTAPSKICVKQPAPSRIQVVDEYIAWANANPSNGPKPAAETMLKFLEGVFPCGK
jgi:opacity protein-like surface antigen